VTADAFLLENHEGIDFDSTQSTDPGQEQNCQTDFCPFYQHLGKVSHAGISGQLAYCTVAAHTTFTDWK
jgi:hypothetical protein